MKKTVWPVSAMIFSNSACMASRVMASTAPKGSSISRISGSDTSALAIPTRCRMPPESSYGIGLFETGETDEFEGMADALPRHLLRRARVPVLQREHDVLVDGAPWQHRVVLEHHGPVGTGSVDDLAVDPDRPFQGLHEPGDHVDQRGLAAAGRADDGDELAAIHVQVHVPKGDEPSLLSLVLVAGTDASNLDQRCPGRRRVAGTRSRAAGHRGNGMTHVIATSVSALTTALQSFAPSCDVTWVMSMGARRKCR